MDALNSLNELYKSIRGVEPSRVELLPGAGSDRRYYRMSDDSGKGQPALIGTVGESVDENRAFIELARFFSRYGVSLPKIYAVSRDELTYIQEDLGSTSLFDIIKREGAECAKVERLVMLSLDALAQMQNVPSEKWCDLTFNRPFSRRQVMWDLNYFKYEYLKPAGVEFNEESLEDDFERLATNLLDIAERCEGLMFRDFQSRNVMIKDGLPCFIDFQGARLGPVIYDAVSFLWQAKANFSDDFRRRMMAYYLNSYNLEMGAELAVSEADIDNFVVFRTLQVLGAYGFRGLVEKKAHFIESIPQALANLKQLRDRGVLDCYPELCRVACKLCSDPRFESNADTDGRLEIKVFSFSYKKGYPEDFTGNGGGYMFDCRGMHNPGRYDEYKPLTGRDEPVIRFLEERGEVQQFVENAYVLSRVSIETYIRRGFKNLQVGFGCTGGRHRSVYCAERYARKIAELYPAARVVLIHREHGIREELSK